MIEGNIPLLPLFKFGISNLKSPFPRRNTHSATSLAFSQISKGSVDFLIRAGVATSGVILRQSVPMCSPRGNRALVISASGRAVEGSLFGLAENGDVNKAISVSPRSGAPS